MWEDKKTSEIEPPLFSWMGHPTGNPVNEWKLYFDKIKEIEGSDLGPVLIDLSKDPAENVDRSKEFPERVKSMLALARELLKGLEQDRVQLGGPQVKLEKKLSRRDG